MKKILSLFLILGTLVTLVSCGIAATSRNVPEKLVVSSNSDGNRVENGLFMSHEKSETDSSFLGYGINLVNHNQVNARNINITYPIFDLDKLSTQPLMKVYENSSEINNIEGSSMSEYIQNLETKFNLNAELKMFGKVDLKAGFTGSYSDKSNFMFKTVNINEQSYYFALQTNPNDYVSLLSERFINDAMELPIETLVKRYGTHILTSVTMGGGINLDYTISSNSQSSAASLSTAIDMSVRTWFSKASGSSSMDYREEAKKSDTNVSVNMKVIGGEAVGIFAEQDIIQKYPEWQKTIATSPALMGIKDSNSLFPIWEIVGMINDSSSAAQRRSAEIQKYFLKIGQENYSDLISQYSKEKIIFPSYIEEVSVVPEGSTETGSIQNITYKTGVIASQDKYKINLKFDSFTNTLPTINYIVTEGQEYVKINSNGVIVPDSKKINELNQPGVNVSVEINAGTTSKTIKLYIQKIHRIDFISNGGSDVKSINNIETGRIVYLAEEPKRLNYRFIGWYLDEELKNEYIFGTEVTSDLILYAKWERLLRVEFYDGVLLDKLMVTVRNGQSIAEVSTPIVKEGYRFIGWYIGKDLNEKYNFGDSVTRDLILYAKWERLLTVNFVSNGQSHAVINKIVSGTVIDKAINPQRYGYRFVGWYEDLSSTIEYNFETPITKDVTLYAKWEEKPKLTLTFEYRDNIRDNYILNNVLPESTVDLSSTPELSSVTRTGYRFLGWFYMYEDQERSLHGDRVYSNITVYAKWEKGNITVIYQGVNGNEHSNPIDISGNAIVGLKDANRVGYDFLGWYNESDERITQIEGKNIIESTVVTAKWAKSKYSIEYQLNGGTKGNNPSIFEYQEVLPLNEATKDGHNFAGWYKDSGLTVRIENTAGLTTSITVYAKWTVKQYNINYEINGGTNHSSNLSQYTYGQIQNFNAPSKFGYNFAGWYKDSSFTQSVTSTEGGNDHITVYAKWNPEVYQITYILNGGTNSSSNKSTYYYEQNEYFSYPSKSGYDFKGWYTDSNFSNRISSTTGIMGNITIYAKWEKTVVKDPDPVKYEYIYNSNGQIIGVYYPDSGITIWYE
ncbi:InlB B-repeat-containing protein [Acholeplasma palmae]|nr:InlB B-repeat-containing protein [Alteracholeplasma palmae]